jgi:hypothetical protein
MHTHCHRCGGELSSGDETTTFCPHCGAPQLYLQEYDRAVPMEAVPSTAVTLPSHLHHIDWRAALRSAAIVAVIAALLNVIALRLPAVFIFSISWIVSAPMTTLALYQRRRPNALMDSHIGARIGLTTGLLLVSGLTAASAIAGLVARFSLHNMGEFDAEIARNFATAKTNALAAATPPPAWMLHLYEQPEFRVGMMLVSVAVTAAILLFLSTLGGAVGGLLRTRRRSAP